MPLECGGSGGRIQGHMPLITPNLPKLNVHAFPVSPSYQGQLIFLQKMLHIPPENQDLVIYPILPYASPAEGLLSIGAPPISSQTAPLSPLSIKPLTVLC